jgi:hypothetical protein
VRVVIDLRVVCVLHWDFTRGYRVVFFGVTSILHCEMIVWGYFAFWNVGMLECWNFGILEFWNLEVCSTVYGLVLAGARSVGGGYCHEFPNSVPHAGEIPGDGAPSGCAFYLKPVVSACKGPAKWLRANCLGGLFAPTRSWPRLSILSRVLHDSLSPVRHSVFWFSIRKPMLRTLSPSCHLLPKPQQQSKDHLHSTTILAVSS